MNLMEQSKISTGDRSLGMAYFIFCAFGLFMSIAMLHGSGLKEGLFIKAYLIFNACTDAIGIFFGIGLFYRKKWIDAFLRPMGWVFLVKVPLGTVLGIITIIYEIRRPLRNAQGDPAIKKQEPVPETGGESVRPLVVEQVVPEKSPVPVDKKEVNRKTARFLFRLFSVIIPVPLALIISLNLIDDFNEPAHVFYGFWFLILPCILAGVVISAVGFGASFLLFKKKKKEQSN
jgi:hypothetical protein